MDGLYVRRISWDCLINVCVYTAVLKPNIYILVVDYGSATPHISPRSILQSGNSLGTSLSLSLIPVLLTTGGKKVEETPSDNFQWFFLGTGEATLP